MAINERIKKIRQELSLSQGEFAEKINLARNSISRIENGSRNPSERTIADICSAFKVNYTWLKDGEGDMFDTTSNDTVMTLLKAEYELDELDVQIIERYLALSPIERQVFKDYIKKMRNA